MRREWEEKCVLCRVRLSSGGSAGENPSEKIQMEGEILLHILQEQIYLLHILRSPFFFSMPLAYS